MKNIAVATLLAVLMAGCGVRGSLDAPEAAKNDPTTSAQSGQGKTEEEAPKAHKGFILDGLLR